MSIESPEPSDPQASRAAYTHLPVMLTEVLESLAPKSQGVYVDATLGLAGHAKAVLDASAPDGTLIGIDRDEEALIRAKESLKPYGARVRFAHGTFSTLPAVLKTAGVERVDGILADLGVSSMQLDAPERGFSFQSEGPLDMRMDASSQPDAKALISELSTEALADVIFQYGEERRSRAVARAIHRARDEGALNTTADLKQAVRRVVGPRRGGTDPVTRTFQALRIAVNRELDEVESLMSQAPLCLKEGGRLVVITFHSLEDRIVKHRGRQDDRLRELHRKPRIASDAERDTNPRSRSAKLRAYERVSPQINASEAGWP